MKLPPFPVFLPPRIAPVVARTPGTRPDELPRRFRHVPIFLLLLFCLPWLAGCQETGLARWELSRKIPQESWSDPGVQLVGYARRGETRRRFLAAWREENGRWRLADATHVADGGPGPRWLDAARRADPLADRVLTVQPFFDGPMPGPGQDFLWRPPVPNALPPPARHAGPAGPPAGTSTDKTVAHPGSPTPARRGEVSGQRARRPHRHGVRRHRKQVRRDPHRRARRHRHHAAYLHHHHERRGANAMDGNRSGPASR